MSNEIVKYLFTYAERQGIGIKELNEIEYFSDSDRTEFLSLIGNPVSSTSSGLSVDAIKEIIASGLPINPSLLLNREKEKVDESKKIYEYLKRMNRIFK